MFVQAAPYVYSIVVHSPALIVVLCVSVFHVMYFVKCISCCTPLCVKLSKLLLSLLFDF